MNRLKIVVAAATLAVAGGAFAQDYSSTPSRERRMSEAYDSYKGKAGSMDNMRSGTMRDSNAMRSDRPSYDKGFKDNMKAAGRQVKEGGREVGHGVAEGARKTGSAAKRGAEKVGNAFKDKPAP